MTSYENLSQEQEEMLYAIGSGYRVFQEQKEEVKKAVEMASKKDLVLIMTHDDVYLLDEASDGLLFKRVREEWEAKALLVEAIRIYNNLVDDGLMSCIGDLLFVHQGVRDLFGCVPVEWEDDVRGVIPSEVFRQEMKLEEWLPTAPPFAKEKLEILQSFMEGNKS